MEVSGFQNPDLFALCFTMYYKLHTYINSNYCTYNIFAIFLSDPTPKTI